MDTALLLSTQNSPGDFWESEDIFEQQRKQRHKHKYRRCKRGHLILCVTSLLVSELVSGFSACPQMNRGGVNQLHFRKLQQLLQICINSTFYISANCYGNLNQDSCGPGCFSPDV